MTPRPTRPLDPDLTEHLDELLAASGRIARRHFYGDLAALAATDKGATDKGATDSNGAAVGGNGHRYDPVTEADRAIEELLRCLLYTSPSPRD